MSAKTATNAGRVPGLDTLRALAIAAVMLYHLNWRLPEVLAPWAHSCWMGVDLFFVLSGYLIGLQLLRPVARGKDVSLREFYRRRAYRILPAYLAVLGLYLVWPGWHEDTGMSPLWEFLTFTENLFVNYSQNHAFSHVWSLCVEEHFYLLLPLLVVWLARKPAAWKTCATLLFFVLLGLAVRWWTLVHVLRPLGAGTDEYSVKYIERVYYPTYARLDGLIAGVALALTKTFRPRVWSAMLRWSGLLLAGGTAMVGVGIWMFWNRFGSATGPAGWSSVAGFPLVSFGMACWVVAASDRGCWLGRWRVPGAERMATLAFSLYLTHKEVAHVLNKRLPTLAGERTWTAGVTYAVGCLMVAWVLYVTVERPFLQLRLRRDRKRIAPEVEAVVDPAI